MTLPTSTASHIARWCLVIILGWIGAMRCTTDGAAAFSQLLTQHAIIGGLFDEGGATFAARVVGFVQIGVSLLLALGVMNKRVTVWGAALATGLLALPITTLLTNPVWIDSLGGFPAIGSGQGIIKYPALAGVALFLYASETQREPLRRLAPALMVGGVMLPLLWIGGMKFTAVEAAGIEPLLASSPFMSWMLPVFGTQGTSIVIGVAELVTVVLLASWWYRRSLYPVAALLTTATFLATLSFLITLPGWHTELGVPALSGAGVFIVKDLGLLAAAIIPLALPERLPDSPPSTS